ncbi:MAG TPA: hypothetical protein VK736_04860 [Candidatus Binatia bacterium]|nr:hypothetical protein [Candidatus Binatia bacterium]
MRPTLIASALLLAAGLACLLVAPQAVSCLSAEDTSVCETAGTIVLNVVGAMQLSVGAAPLFIGHKATT